MHILIEMSLAKIHVSGSKGNIKRTGILTTFSIPNCGKLCVAIICYYMYYYYVNILFYLYSDACSSNVRFAGGIGKFWLNTVDCSGSEVTIDNCTHSDWGKDTDHCSHSQDAAVVCKTSGKTLSSQADFHPMQLLFLLNIALH